MKEGEGSAALKPADGQIFIIFAPIGPRKSTRESSKRISVAQWSPHLPGPPHGRQPDAGTQSAQRPDLKLPGASPPPPCPGQGHLARQPGFQARPRAALGLRDGLCPSLDLEDTSEGRNQICLPGLRGDKCWGFLEREAFVASPRFFPRILPLNCLPAPHPQTLTRPPRSPPNHSCPSIGKPLASLLRMTLDPHSNPLPPAFFPQDLTWGGGGAKINKPGPSKKPSPS